MKHLENDVSAYNFFMTLSELERRFEKVKILSLRNLCYLRFLPTRDVCWVAGT